MPLSLLTLAHDSQVQAPEVIQLEELIRQFRQAETTQVEEAAALDFSLAMRSRAMAGPSGWEGMVLPDCAIRPGDEATLPRTIVPTRATVRKAAVTRRTGSRHRSAGPLRRRRWPRRWPG